MYKYTLLLLAFGLFLTNCKDDLSPAEQLVKDRNELRKYAADKGLQVDSTASGIYYVHTVLGSGAAFPSATSDVTVRYKGYFLNGEIFDQTDGTSTATFNLSQLIAGWREGIRLMKKGGKTTMLIPSGLAYGTEGQGSIPGNTPLAFDIELVNF